MKLTVCVVLLFSACLYTAAAEADDAPDWIGLAEKELEEALNIKLNTNRAKNVILFIGDGMGPNTVTATRIHKHGESGHLSFEKFPHVGLLKTYCNDKQIPDSASTATALFTGVKTNFETAGVDGTVLLNDCESSLREEARLKSLIGMAQEAEMSTGFVTTMRVTHATPSALYAHTASRKWECETKMPPRTELCKDIARQLIEDEPGRSINVIMGGGRQTLMENTTITPGDPLDTWSCQRKDGRNLIQTWTEDKINKSVNYAIAQNNAELESVDTNTTEFLLGIFANGHMSWEHQRDKSISGMPSVTMMTETAIKILEKNKKGYFLMVEGGNIDMAHHRGHAKIAINEANTMDEAVKRAIELTDPTNTLIVVTSDHTHSLAINGYSKRGADIFGLSIPSKADNKTYTTLTYSTGAKDAFQFSVAKDGETDVVDRRDPINDNTTDYEYINQAGILTDESTHGGGDVIIYAKGPHGHLFHNIHEQHYVTHAVSYAAGIGKYIEFRPNNSRKTADSNAILIILFSLGGLLRFNKN